MHVRILNDIFNHILFSSMYLNMIYIDQYLKFPSQTTTSNKTYLPFAQSKPENSCLSIVSSIRNIYFHKPLAKLFDLIE